MRPLRILQIAALPFPSHQGSQVYVGGMARALARRGHDVVLCCYADGDGPDPEGVTVVRARGVPGGEATRRSGPHWSRIPQDLLLARAVRRALRTGVDVVHGHHVEAPIVARLAGARAPVVYNLHTQLSEELPTYLPRVPGLRWAGAAVDRVVPRLCDGAVAISKRAAADLRRRVERVAHIPPGVDIDDLRGGDGGRARRRWALGERRWVVYAGNADAYQDLPVLLTAMRDVVGADLLVVTGSDPSEVQRMAASAGLPAQRCRVVHSAAFVDTLDALAVAEVAALPRTRCAGFPIKLLNQLGAGVPTVAAAGSSRSIPGVVVVPDGDARAMAASIEGLLGDPDRLAALGRSAKEAVARDWTWDRRAAQLEAFYWSLLR